MPQAQRPHALGLDFGTTNSVVAIADADRRALRTRYTELVRRYHPDHNGGDRAHEQALQDVLAAYAHLRKAPAFA